MKSTFARWIILWSIDSDRELPHWVRRQIERDSDLRQLTQSSQSLEKQLRRSAQDWSNKRAWIDKPASDHRHLAEVSTQASRHPVNARTVIALLVAAALLVGLGNWLVPQPTGPQVVDQPSVPEVTTSDMRPVLATLSASRQVAQRIGGSTSKLFSELVASAQLPFDYAAIDVAGQTRFHVEAAGKKYGNAMKHVRDSLQ